jgi:predicted permease
MHMTWLKKLGVARRRERLDADLEAELAGHLALKQQRLEAEGMAPEEAARQARLALGNPAVYGEEAREQWTFAGLESWWQDARFGMRVLRKDKLFTGVALLTLALAVGGNTAIFTLLNSLLWRALPVKQPEQLVRMRATNLPPTGRTWSNGREIKTLERRQLSFALYEALRQQKDVFAGVFGIGGQGRMVVQMDGAALQMDTTQVTGSYFQVLGVEPVAGRLLTEADDVPGGGPDGWALVISDAAWARLFGRSPAAIGKQVTMERVPFTIVGVAPATFHGVSPGVNVELWAPLSSMEATNPEWQWRTNRRAWMLETYGRLAPGLEISQADARMGAMSRSLLARAQPDGMSAQDEKYHLAIKLGMTPGRTGSSWLFSTFGPALWVLMAALGAMLLIAATNLTNLLLARSSARKQEIAVRLALGASAGKVKRQLMVESMILAGAGGVLGVMLAKALTQALIEGVAGEGGILLETPLDWNVLGFVAVLLGVVVVVVGWAPAWSALRGALQHGERQRAVSKATATFRAGLVVVHVAFSLTLLLAAVLLVSSLRSLLSESTGLDKAQTVFVQPDLYNAGVSRERMPRAYEEILNAARRLPGVRAAAWTMMMPLSGSLMVFTVEVPGSGAWTKNERMVFGHRVTDGYFAAAGVPLLAGRDLAGAGQGGPSTVVVSQKLAVKFYGSVAGAIGKRIKPGNMDWAEIVGVVADAKFAHVREPGPPTIYTSYWEDKESLGMTLVVNQSGSREALLTALRRLFEQQAGRTPLTTVKTIDDNLRSSMSMERMLAWVLSGFALFALLIAATGIAGVLGYAVQLRRREIGIRLALGATPGGIARQFERYGLSLAMAGLVLGSVLSYWLRKVIGAFLFRTDAAEPLLWAGVCALLLLCAAGAAALPARRAAALQPSEVLRAD